MKRITRIRAEPPPEIVPCYLLLKLELKDYLTSTCASSSCFQLEKAVCNHGFFMLAPNVWIPSTKTLRRPLWLADFTTSVTVSISQPPYTVSPCLFIRVHGTQQLPPQDQQAIVDQVARMLRISTKDEKDVHDFQNAHPEAKKNGFGRLFRSPTLFEDVVKSILLCNCSWERTVKMAEALCDLRLNLTNQGRKELKRKRGGTSKLDIASETMPRGNFPSPKELASVDEVKLNKYCSLGYRAERLLKFSESVASGRLNLAMFEETETYNLESSEKLFSKLMKIKGFGAFACANVMMCLGFYHRIPEDSETIRHLIQIHSKKDCDKKTISSDVKEMYGKYAPFQCLAYWFELVNYYESRLGKLCDLPRSSYSKVTGSKF